MGCLLVLVLEKPIQVHHTRYTRTRTTKKQKKPIDVYAFKEELTFLEMRCEQLIDLLNCIDLIYGKPKDTKKQAQLIRKRMTIDAQYHAAMQRRYKLERLLNQKGD